MGVSWVYYLIFAASMIGTPGPANMVLMSAGARYGLRASLPFVAGVALGKQIVIWPMGFGLLTAIAQVPLLLMALKWISIGYILFLAWKIAGSRLAPGEAPSTPPSFAAGLIVHPLNPKAWAMISTGFTAYVDAGTSPLVATAVIAACLLACQIVLHPLYCSGGAWLARLVAGRPAERGLMVTLALLTVGSVFLVLFAGDAP